MGFRQILAWEKSLIFKALENHPLFSKCFLFTFQRTHGNKKIFSIHYFISGVFGIFAGIYARSAELIYARSAELIYARSAELIYARSAELISLCILAYTIVFRQFDHH